MPIEKIQGTTEAILLGNAYISGIEDIYYPLTKAQSAEKGKQTIHADNNRTAVVGIPFSIFSKKFKNVAENTKFSSQYIQGKNDGSDTKLIFIARAFQTHKDGNDTLFNKRFNKANTEKGELSFSYPDDKGNMCTFSLFCDFESQSWIIKIDPDSLIKTNKENQALVFVHHGKDKDIYERNKSENTFKVDVKLIEDSELSEELQKAINSTFISTLIADLIDDKGHVSKEAYLQLSNVIKPGKDLELEKLSEKINEAFEVHLDLHLNLKLQDIVQKANAAEPKIAELNELKEELIILIQDKQEKILEPLKRIWMDYMVYLEKTGGRQNDKYRCVHDKIVQGVFNNKNLTSVEKLIQLEHFFEDHRSELRSLSRLRIKNAHKFIDTIAKILATVVLIFKGLEAVKRLWKTTGENMIQETQETRAQIQAKFENSIQKMNEIKDHLNKIYPLQTQETSPADKLQQYSDSFQH